MSAALVEQLIQEQQQKAEEVLTYLKSIGATQADVFLEASIDLTVKVRNGRIVELQQSRPQGIGFRFFAGHQSAFAYSSSLDMDDLKALADGAKERAAMAPEIPYDELRGKQAFTALESFDEDLLGVTLDDKISYVKAVEEAAIAQDKRIFTTEPSMFSDSITVSTLATSEGVMVSRKGTAYICYSAPVAEAAGVKYRGGKGSMKTTWGERMSAEELGAEAGKRTFERIGAKKVKSGKVPVIFSPDAAADTLGRLIGAFSGDALSKNATFLAGKLGKQIGAAELNIIDDPHMKGGVRSTGVDDEGVPTSKKYLVREGVVETFLYDSRTANKVQTEPTGNGFRGGYASTPGLKPTNLYIEPGSASTEEIFASVDEGYMVTDFLGFGFDLVRGEMSVGTEGFWISKGEKTFPVHEVTIASSLPNLLGNIELIGNHIEFSGATNAPHIKVSEMSLSGT